MTTIKEVTTTEGFCAGCGTWHKCFNGTTQLVPHYRRAGSKLVSCQTRFASRTRTHTMRMLTNEADKAS